jgi:hypothetical protein
MFPWPRCPLAGPWGLWQNGCCGFIGGLPWTRYGSPKQSTSGRMPEEPAFFCRAPLTSPQLTGVVPIVSSYGKYNGSHGFRTTFTIARIPALTSSGRLLHAPTTLIKSSGKPNPFACTHVAQFGCSDPLLSCSGNVDFCMALEDAEPGNIPICLLFAWIGTTSVSEVLLRKGDRRGVRFPPPPLTSTCRNFLLRTGVAAFSSTPTTLRCTSIARSSTGRTHVQGVVAG